MLKNKQEIHEFRKNLRNLKVNLIPFQATTLRKIVEMDIVETIQQRMRARGFSEKIVINTTLDRIEIRGGKKVRIFIKSEYIDPDTGFDVAYAREKGTKDHDTTHYDDQGKKTTQAFVDGGIQKFSKGHWVSGMPTFEIIKNTILDRTQNVQDDYNRALKEYLSKQTGAKL